MGGRSKGRLVLTLVVLCLGAGLASLLAAQPGFGQTVPTNSPGTNSGSPLIAPDQPTLTTQSVQSAPPTLVVKPLPPPPKPVSPESSEGPESSEAPPVPVVTSTPVFTPAPPPPVVTPPAAPPVVHHNAVHHHAVVARHHQHRVVRHRVVRAVKAVHAHRVHAAGLPHPVRVTETAATPLALKFKPAGIALAALLGGFLVLLLAFPSELFNKTYQENEAEIHFLFRRAGLTRYHLRPIYGLIAFVLLGVALSVWVALDEGSKGNIAAVALGALIALPVVTFAFELPREFYGRFRSKARGTLHVLPTALAVGLVCAIVSRALHLHPAYLYGVFAGFAAAAGAEVGEAEEGKSILIAVIALAVIMIAAWFGWGALDAQAHGPHRDWFVIIASTGLFWIFMLGAEALVFGLMPLRYLDGSALRRWRTLAWLLPQFAAAAFFVYVQMLHGETEKINTINQLVRPFALFLVFGVLSFAFWGYFRWNGRPTRLTREEEYEEDHERLMHEPSLGKTPADVRMGQAPDGSVASTSTPQRPEDLD